MYTCKLDKSDISSINRYSKKENSNNMQFAYWIYEKFEGHIITPWGTMNNTEW